MRMSVDFAGAGQAHHHEDLAPLDLEGGIDHGSGGAAAQLVTGGAAFELADGRFGVLAKDFVQAGGLQCSGISHVILN